MKHTINKEIKITTILCFTLFFTLLFFDHYHDRDSSVFFENKVQEDNLDKHNKQLKNNLFSSELKVLAIFFLRFLIIGLAILFFLGLSKLLLSKLLHSIHEHRSIKQIKNHKYHFMINNCYQLKNREKEMNLYFERYKKIFEQESYRNSLDKNNNYYEAFDHIYGNIDKRPIEEMLTFLDSSISIDNEEKVVIFTFGYKEEKKQKIYDFLIKKKYSPYMHDITFEKFLDRFLQRDFNRNTNEENVYDSLVNLFKYLLIYSKKICFVSKKGKEKYKINNSINDNINNINNNKKNNSFRNTIKKSFFKLINNNPKQKEKEKLLKHLIQSKIKKEDLGMKRKFFHRYSSKCNLVPKSEHMKIINEEKKVLLNKNDFTFDFNYFYKLLSEKVCQKDKHKLLHFQLD